MPNIQNFEELSKKVHAACVKVRSEFHRDILDNLFPIQIKQWSSPFEKYTHIFYDAEFGKDKAVIKYLTPTSLNIYMTPIMKAFERAGFQYTEDYMYVKAAEVLVVHQFYHMNCYNKKNFKRYADYINGQLTMGDDDIEIMCFGLTGQYYRRNNDMRGANICSLFSLLYDKDTIRSFEPEINDSILKDLRHKIVKSFRPDPALV